MGNPRKRRFSEPQIKAPPHNSSISKKRPSSSRQTVKMRDAENDLRPRHTPLGSKLKPLASGVQIPRKLFSMVRKIFEEHDADGDGFISEREFIRAVSRADEAQGEREAERISERYFDKGMGATVGGLAAVTVPEGRNLKCSMHPPCFMLDCSGEVKFLLWILWPCTSPIFLGPLLS